MSSSWFTFPRRARAVGSLLFIALLSASALAAPPIDPLSLTADAAASTNVASGFAPDRKRVLQAPAPAPARTDLASRIRDQAADLAVAAMNLLGVPYQRGGNSIDQGFDCSGFTRQVFETTLAISLPRSADEQARAPGLVGVGRDQLQAGDLVFFNTLGRTFSHVGIFLGNDRFIHAPRPGAQVRVENFGLSYWSRRFTGARRAETLLAQADPAARDTLQVTAPGLGRDAP
ncbi:MAG: C40 family peptidase [Burkholderiaceae bacterium]